MMLAIIPSAELQFIETPGGNSGTGLATPSRGATEVSVIRQRQQPGGSNPPHSHDREEVLFLLAGTVTVTTAGERQTVEAGDTVIVPAQTPHQIANTGTQPAEWLLIAPAGIRFFHANGEEASPPWAR